MSLLPEPPRALQRGFVRRTRDLGYALIASALLSFGSGFLFVAHDLPHFGLLGFLGAYVLLAFGVRLETRHALSRSGVEQLVAPPPGAKKLLFLDEWNTRAVAVGDSRQRVFLRDDFWPLQLTAAEEKWAREWLKQQREINQLVTNPFSC